MANIVTGREDDLELWIRPERAGYGYTIEWTTLDDHDEQEWRLRGIDTGADEDDQRSVWDALRELLTRIRAYVTLGS